MNIVPYKELEYIADLNNELDPNKELFFDTETEGLYGRIRLAQFYQKDLKNVYLVHYPDYFGLAALLNQFRIVMHNASYDISTIQVELPSYIPSTIEDTLYLSRLHFYTKEKFSLDEVMYYTLGYDPYVKQGLQKSVLQKSDWAVPVLTEEQKIYAATDVYYLPAVYETCIEQRESISYQLDMLALSYSFEFQTNGLPVNQDKVHALYKSNLEQVEALDVPVNVNSYKQVRPYIGSNKSDALGLAYLTLKGNEKAKKVNEARKLLKTNSFLKKFITNDGRIYGKFAPSARSGRFTCKDQNLEQLPRKTKGVFGVPEDRVLIYSDYPQLELRAACVITNEQAMAELFRAGADLHGYTAEMLFGKDYTKTQRQIAKTCNFNLLYGGGHKVLGDILVKEAGILLSESELLIIKRKWLNLWKTIAKWQQQGISAWRKGQAWQTPLGRKYFASRMTDQLNIRVQGFGAEVAKLAMHYMMPKLIEEVKLVNFIHDSYILECPNDPIIYETAAEVLAEAMQEAWFEACKCVTIKDLPMPVEVKVGFNWGDIEKDIYIHRLTQE